MQGTIDFLRHVLPRKGPYCIALWKPEVGPNGAFQQHAVDGIEDAAALAIELDEVAAYQHATNGKQWSVFFAVGALIKSAMWDAKQGRDRVFRIKENMRELRAYTMDMDAGVKGDGTERAYPTVEAAAADLKRFCKTYDLPRPTIVNSGSGLHVYWTLTDEVPAEQWAANGVLLADMARAIDVKCDRGRTVDRTSVLRVVGCRNNKYAHQPYVTQECLGADTTPDDFHAKLVGVQAVPASAKPGPSAAALGLAGAPQLNLGTNIQKYEREAVKMTKVAERCAAFRLAVTEQARTPEPVWTAVIQIVAHCKKPRELARAVSQDHGSYSQTETDAKLDRYWDAATGYPTFGPGTCKQFEHGWDAVGEHPCAACPSFGKITSPVQLGRIREELPPIKVQEVDPETGEITEREIVEPGEKYVRTPHGIGLKYADPKTQQTETLIFCPYDMYPMRQQFNEETNKEHGAVWRVNYPNEGWKEVQIPYVAKAALGLTLQTYGIHIHPPHLDHMATFMSHYLKKLQDKIPREMEYAKMGWRPEGFILGDTLFRNDGKTEKHVMSTTLAEAVSSSIFTRGTREGWIKTAQMYNRDGLAPFRIEMYTSLAAPLFHMTNLGSTVVNISGPGGKGKTTILKVCAAMWGEPINYMCRATTQTASEAFASAFNNAPVMIDELTMKNERESAQFVFSISGGKGKMRGRRDGTLRTDTATWSTIFMTNANNDVYADMAVVHRDASPYVARLIQIECPATGAISKAEGDWITAQTTEHFGWIGREFVRHVAMNREAVAARLAYYITYIGEQVDGRPEERFWIGWGAACCVAAEIAEQLGILPDFPIAEDIEWICDHIEAMRVTTSQHVSDPAEIITDFLDAHLVNTLALSTNSGNIDNIAQEPRGELYIRRELDTGVALISRKALSDYCTTHHIAMDRMVSTLVTQGICTGDSVSATLGAHTKYQTGRTRCVRLDLNRLGGKLTLVPTGSAVAAAAPSAVA